MLQASQSLIGKVVAVPENRRLDLLSKMLQKRGAKVIAVPMVAILDAPDSRPVLDWIKSFIHQPPDMFILLTGEGLRRLVKLAEDNALKSDFISALGKVDKLCRGPKPNQALREIGLNRQIDALVPTTDGVIDRLNEMPISGKRIAVQLYGEEPNLKLINYLEKAGGLVNTVAPYVYANKLDDEKIIDLIWAMHNDEIDVIAFSSQPQVNRLFKLAKTYQLEAELSIGLGNCHVAAIGPVVNEVLASKGVKVDIIPQRTFFMKPFVTSIANFLNKQS